MSVIMLQDYAEEWWIDNVFEELDAPNEFWFNASSGQLYLACDALATILLYYYYTATTILLYYYYTARAVPAAPSKPAICQTKLRIVGFDHLLYYIYWRILAYIALPNWIYL